MTQTDNIRYINLAETLEKGTKSGLYYRLHSMVTRCYCKTSPRFPDYGCARELVRAANRAEKARMA